MSQVGMKITISKVVWLYKQATAWCFAESFATPDGKVTGI